MITVIFFVSPVTWQTKTIGNSSLIVAFYLVTYLMDLVRPALLGQPPHFKSFIICLILLIAFMGYRIRCFLEIQ